MSRSRPASNPLSYHKQTKQYYVTRGGRRSYLGVDQDKALEKYHRLSLGMELVRIGQRFVMDGVWASPLFKRNSLSI